MKKLFTILFIAYSLFSVANSSNIENYNTITPAGSAVMSGGGVICSGDPIPDIVINLTGTAPWSITYFNGTSSTTISTSSSPYVISNGIDGTYTLVSVSDAGGPSTTTGSVSIITNPLPAALISGGGTICTGDPIPDIVINLIGTGPWSLTYFDGTSSTLVSTNSSPYTISNGADGVYSVISVTDATGCSGTASGTGSISTNPLPLANAGMGQTLDCNNASVSLTATGGGTYSWVASGGGNITSGANSSTITANAAGTYTVMVTSGGCSDTDVAIVTSDLAPPTVNTGIDQVLDCIGTPLTLTATGGGTYSWTASGGGNIISGASTSTATVDAAGIYTVTVTGTNGCTDTDNATVSNSSNPPTPTAGTNATYCEGDAIADLFAVSSGGILKWYDDAGLTNMIGTGTVISPVNTVGTSTYFVTESIGGCESSASLVTISIYSIATLTVSASSPSTCAGFDGTLNLSGLLPSTSYQINYLNDGVPVSTTIISNSAGDVIIFNLDAGTYSNIEAGISGCTSSLLGPYVLVDPNAPTFTIGAMQIPSGCGIADGSITINGLSSSTIYNLTYNVNGISVGPASITTNSNGDYIISGLQSGFYDGITVELNGCVTTDVGVFILVPIFPAAPIAFASNDTTFTEYTINITAISAFGGSINWYDDSTLTNQVASNTGTYSATETIAGTYTYHVTETLNNCEGSSSGVSITFESQVGVSKNISSDKIHFYPNPNNGSFYLKLENIGDINFIKIIDAQGSVIYFKENRFNEKIELPHLTSGLFYIIIKSIDNYRQEKLVIVK